MYHQIASFIIQRKISRRRRLQNLTVIRYDVEWLRGRVYDYLTDTDCQRRRHTFLIKTIVSSMSMEAIAGLFRPIIYYIDKLTCKIRSGGDCKVDAKVSRWFGMEKRISSGTVEARKEPSKEGNRGDIEGPHARAAHRYAITWLQPTWSACACPLFVTEREKKERTEGERREKEYSLIHSHLYVSSLPTYLLLI